MSLTYNVLTTTQRSYLHNLASVQPHRCTRCSSFVSLVWPPISSWLRLTDRYCRYDSLCIWNQLPASLRQPHHSLSVSETSSCAYHIITLCRFTILINHNSLTLSDPPVSQILSTVDFLLLSTLPLGTIYNDPAPFLLSTSVFVLVIFVIFSLYPRHLH